MRRNASSSMKRKIRASEIFVGAVVNLDPKKLKSDSRVVRTIEAVDPQERLFVCYAKLGECSSWSPLSSRAEQAKGYERLPIDPKWKVQGSVKWRERDNVLYDGANTLHGPDDAFAAASADESSSGDLGWMVSDGVDAVRGEILAQFGRREQAAGTGGGETVDVKGNPVFHGDPQ